MCIYRSKIDRWIKYINCITERVHYKPIPINKPNNTLVKEQNRNSGRFLIIPNHRACDYGDVVEVSKAHSEGAPQMEWSPPSRWIRMSLVIQYVIIE